MTGNAIATPSVAFGEVVEPEALPLNVSHGWNCDIVLQYQTDGLAVAGHCMFSAATGEMLLFRLSSPKNPFATSLLDTTLDLQAQCAGGQVTFQTLAAYESDYRVDSAASEFVSFFGTTGQDVGPGDGVVWQNHTLGDDGLLHVESTAEILVQYSARYFAQWQLSCVGWMSQWALHVDGELVPDGLFRDCGGQVLFDAVANSNITLTNPIDQSLHLFGYNPSTVVAVLTIFRVDG